jgi:hypothetical protein
MSLIQLLVVIIVLGLLLYLVSLAPLPAPFKTAAHVVVILIAIIWLLSVTGLLGAHQLRISGLPITSLPARAA